MVSFDQLTNRAREKSSEVRPDPQRGTANRFRQPRTRTRPTQNGERSAVPMLHRVRMHPRADRGTMGGRAEDASGGEHTEVEGDIVVGVIPQLDASCLRVVVAFAVSGVDVFRIGSVLVRVEGDAHRECVVDRAAVSALEFDLVEAAIGEAGIPAHRVGGLSRSDDDGAAGGIVAEQRSLRPLQHLHLVHIEHPEVCIC